MDRPASQEREDLLACLRTQATLEALERRALRWEPSRALWTRVPAAA